MAIIPGITPKSPVIGEELNSDNFAVVAGQYSVKIDPAGNVVPSSSATGLKLQAPLGGNIIGVVTNVAPSVILPVANLFEVSMPASTDVRIRALVARQVYITSEGEYPGGSFTTSTAAIVNLGTAFVPADNNVHVAGELNVVRVQDILTGRLFVVTVWRLAGIAGNWSGWVEEIGVTTLSVSGPAAPTTNVLAVADIGPGPTTSLVSTVNGVVSSIPVSALPDFFRSANGGNTPDGASDFTEAITHNGNLGIRQTADPVSPLHFGDIVQNDVIRLFTTASNPHQFYGFGVNPDVLRYQVNNTTSAHRFYGASSATTSKQFASLKDRDAIFGDPLAAGEGHWQIGTAGVGDNGYIRFRSPDGAAGANKIQAEIVCDAFSGNGGVNGSTMEFRTATTTGPNTPLITRMQINGNGDLMVSDPNAPYSASTGSAALVTINGALRVRGGALVAGGGPTRQSGGIIFGAGVGAGGVDTTGTLGDTDGGISSTVDGRIDIYCNGAAAFTFAAGGVASKQGGGLWAVLSDVRTKRNIAAHTPNPMATLALEPIEFYYNGEGGSIDDGKRHVGFSAQNLQQTAFSHWVTVGSEAIDGEAVRQVDLSNLTYELLGVVKMQAKAIEALELRLAALEPKTAITAQIAKRK